MKWYLKVMTEYANFNGRAQRAEYWYFMLMYIIMIVAILVIESIIMEAIPVYDAFDTPIMTNIFVLGHIIPSIAVSVRRLHDINKSGWWYLINFIPFIGLIVFLIFMAKKSGENKI